MILECMEDTIKLVPSIMRASDEESKVKSSFLVPVYKKSGHTW